MRNGKRRNWDDEYVLKRQFNALIPAFDPRPGRTNVNQTTDLEIALPTDQDSNIQVSLTSILKILFINLKSIINSKHFLLTRRGDKFFFKNFK
jgi:hypothetical protein